MYVQSNKLYNFWLFVKIAKSVFTSTYAKEKKKVYKKKQK